MAVVGGMTGVGLYASSATPAPIEVTRAPVRLSYKLKPGAGPTYPCRRSVVPAARSMETAGRVLEGCGTFPRGSKSQDVYLRYVGSCTTVTTGAAPASSG